VPLAPCLVDLRPSSGLLRLLAAGVLASSCASSPSAPTAPTPDDAPTITITSAGVSPNAVTVALGGRVLFVNHDAVSHNVSSDPHPERDQCPEINQVGFLEPGDSRETGNFVTAETCGFHDFDMAFVTSLQGTITVK
jgi:plastocyanin